MLHLHVFRKTHGCDSFSPAWPILVCSESSSTGIRLFSVTTDRSCILIADQLVKLGPGDLLEQVAFLQGAVCSQLHLNQSRSGLILIGRMLPLCFRWVNLVISVLSESIPQAERKKCLCQQSLLAVRCIKIAGASA